MLYKSSSVHSTPMQSIFNKMPLFQGAFSQLIAVLSTLIVNSDSQRFAESVDFRKSETEYPR